MKSSCAVVDDQTKIRVAREDHTVDRRRYDKVRIDLFGLFERGNLTVTGSEQLEFFESRAHMRFMRGMRRRDFLFFLLAGGSQFDEILRAFEFLVFCVKLRQIGNVLCFGFGEFAAEDDRQRLSAFDVIAKHHGNFFHDAAHERCHMDFAVFIGLHDSRNAKFGCRHAVRDTRSANLRFLEIVRCQIDLQFG